MPNATNLHRCSRDIGVAASTSAMAFHEKAGPSQVDFDLPFLKIHLPS